ncbi:hypothetical protein PM082_004161 [Marasmius tenuissimus]|nr:hypothetical protein PM082_004161 [Marasmius tenuissimus]
MKRLVSDLLAFVSSVPRSSSSPQRFPLKIETFKPISMPHQYFKRYEAQAALYSFIRWIRQGLPVYLALQVLIQVLNRSTQLASESAELPLDLTQSGTQVPNSQNELQRWYMKEGISIWYNHTSLSCEIQRGSANTPLR